MRKRISVYTGLFILMSYAIPPKKKITIWMVGDSTMSVKEAKAWPETGWGVPFATFFDSSVTVSNHARNGRSTRTFITEGLWEKVINNVQPGDYVFIQFGHNDEVPTKASATKPEEFKTNLERYVRETRSKQAHPVLLTSIARRKFDSTHKALGTHDQYAAILREVAKNNKVLFIDMYKKSQALLQQLGPEASKTLFLWLTAGEHPNYPGGSQDDTHFNEVGARVMAQMVLSEMKNVLPGLTDRVVFKSTQAQQPFVSKAWVADNKDGTYKNPILFADYSDPDVCRVGDDYYMTASSFNVAPGLPILHSKDLVNWSLIGHALERQPPVDHFSKPQHGNGVWAPAIRYRNGEFYIYYPDPDFGIYLTKAKKITGPWSEPVLVEGGKGLIDPCPLWDDDGNVYLAHAYAGSRAGIKSVLVIKKLNAAGTKTIDAGRLVYDGHGIDPTIEGPKLHKRNGYYYIFAPAGGVATGWQLVLRSKNIYGPYERKVVMDQGTTTVNGPHQGAWIDTKTGEDWFIHFQELSSYGRIVHLQPMKWKSDWPVIGVDKDGDGKGEPVLIHKKPAVGAVHPVQTPIDGDEFNSSKLGLQWQWHANPQTWWAFPAQGYLRMFSALAPDSSKNLWTVPNLLLQKFPAEEFTATVKFNFKPALENEKMGLIVMGYDYAYIALTKKGNGVLLSWSVCKEADKGTAEKTEVLAGMKADDMYFRLQVRKGGICTFSTSVDGNNFNTISDSFTAQPGRWIGAKLGLFISRATKTNDAGFVDVDWFRIEK